jgi:dCMP deaminase
MPIKHNYYMKLAYNEAQKSEHPTNKKVGCILINNNDIFSYGHNKMLISDYSTELLNNKNSRTHLMCHAEEMCLAAKSNEQKITDNTILYITAIPCSTCARLIVLSGIKNIVYPENALIGSQWKESCEYSQFLLKSEKINIIKLKNELIHNGVCYCLTCNVFMGDDNPRQLCRKTYCDNSELWHCYDNNKIVTVINTSFINKKKRKEIYV